VKHSTKIVLTIGGIIVFAALVAWLGGLTGFSGGSGKISLQGTVIEVGTPGRSFKIFCPGSGLQTIAPNKDCKILRTKQVGLDQVPADRFAEIKGLFENNQTIIRARSLTVFPAGKNREEELAAYRVAGTLIKHGKILAIKAKGKEIAVQASPATSIVVEDSPDLTDPTLDSIVEVHGRSGWWSVKAEQIAILRSGPEVEDVPGLPRVLLLGGQIARRSIWPVRNALKGIANVHQGGAGSDNTDTTLENIEGLLGPYQSTSHRWTVIYFSFGFRDLRLVNGKNQVPLERYTRNLQAILTRLSATHAKLIWATAPPVPQDRPRPDIRAEDIRQYNTAAVKVMEQNKIEINDLAELLPAKLPAVSKDPQERNKILAKEIAAAIKHALGQ
jgi:hypothetical protein